GEKHYVHELVARPGPATVTNTDDPIGMCLISGGTAPLARLHEPRIKGVAGSQTSGALLVSFNASAFTSYDKDQSYNAPVSGNIAFKYTNALNHLLADRERRLMVGDMTIVYRA